MNPTLRNLALALLAAVLMALSAFVGAMIPMDVPASPPPLVVLPDSVSAPAVEPAPIVEPAAVVAPDAVEATGDGSGSAPAPTSPTEAAPVGADHPTVL